MSEIVNLRRARKEKARGAKDKNAANNRVKHGAPKAARDLAQARAEKSAHDLDAHKLKDK
ncbi:MAG TPA: DUF4169 family protein [Rhizomicrobium sp.]|jgi:hypothetical protein